MKKRILTVLLLFGVLVFARPEREKITGYFYTPAAYVSVANRLIRDPRQLIDYDCENGIIQTHFEPESPEERWFQNSYLKRDVDAFNDNPRANLFRFDIESCQLLGVNARARTIPLPTAGEEPRLWLGELRYAGGNIGGTLRGAEQMLGIRRELGPLNAADTDSVRMPVARAGQKPADLMFAESPLFRFQMRAPGERGSEVMGDVRLIGPTGVLQDRRDLGVLQSHSLLLMGRGIPRGRVVALEDGDWLQFAAKRNNATARETYLYTTRDLTRLISSAAIRNGSPFRTTHPNTVGMAEGIVTALDQMVRDNAAGPEWAHADLELTIDRSLQGEMTRHLREVMTPKAGRRQVPIRGAVTMMDTFTGDVLAAASYPTLPSDVSRFTYLSETRRASYLENQNFVTHPIGSAGKPFWGAAILHVIPEMESYRVQAHAGRPDWPTVIGYPLRPGYETHNHAALDYVGFLAHSCNKYLIDAATVALAIDSGCQAGVNSVEQCLQLDRTVPLEAADSFSIGRRRYSFRPRLDKYMKNNAFVGIEQSPLLTAFRAITGGETFGEGAAEPADIRGNTSPDLFRQWYRNSRAHLTPWLRLLTAAPEIATWEADQRADLVARFARVSPAASNLSVNTVDNIRSEWVNMLLGGGTSMWNNIQLGEALSRLVTGWQVRANMVKSLRTRDGAALLTSAPEPPELQLAAAARTATLRGMQAVVTEGTATTLLRTSGDQVGLRARLESALPQYTFQLYAKTGTPRLEIMAPPAYFRAVHNLLNGSGLEFNIGGPSLSITSTGREILRKSAPGLTADIENLVEAFNDEPEAYESPNGAKSRNSPFVIESGRIRAQQPANGARRILETKGGVLILSIVATPRAANLVRQPIGVSLAIYIEDTPANSEEAVQFARRIGSVIVEGLKNRERVQLDVLASTH